MEMVLKKTATWVPGILTGVVVAAFAMSGAMKVIHSPEVVQAFTRAGIPEGAILPLGLLELVCVALYLIPETVVLGTLLLTGYLGGAVLANIIGHTDFIHALVIGLLVWAGAWFRVAELRALIPIRDESGKELLWPRQ
jgi:hypothetical protein